MRTIAKPIPENAQATTVRALGKLVRSYVESDNFKQEYRQWLKQKYPVDETYNDAVVAQREQEVGGMISDQPTNGADSANVCTT